MKKNILALGLAAMMLALPGCVKDTTNDLTDGVQGELVKHTFKVSMELPQAEDGSRLTLDENNAFVWEDQDVITVMGSDGKDYAATIDLQGMDGLRLDEGVEFTVELPAGVTAKYAWRNIANDKTADVPTFGASGGTGDKVNASSITGRLGLPLNQMLASKNLEELVNQLPMIGTIENGCIYMRNIFGIAELRVKGSGRLWSAHIFSRTLSFRGAYGHISLTSKEPVWNSYNTAQQLATLSPMGMASVNLGGMTLAGDQPTSVYFAVPIADGEKFITSYTHAAGELGVILRGDVDNGDDFAITKFSGKAHTFARNMVTPMTVTYARPTTGETAVDLTAAGGDSNCFMIAPQGTETHYKFRAYNNSNAAIATGCMAFPAWHTPNCPVVKDMWFEGVASPAPYVHFTVQGGTQNGSMVIAIAKGSDTKHWCTDIYHVWVTDAEDQTYGGITVLDRNIGATYAPKSAEDVKNMDGRKAAETCGFYYQWGRQTPFAGPITLDGTLSNDNIYGWENGKNTSHLNTNWVFYRTMPWSASGMTSYPNSSKNTTAYKDYLFSTMHCTTDGIKYQWSTDLASPISGNSTAWILNGRGAQDPCPQGYRVATHDELVTLFRYPKGSTGGHMMYRHWDIDQSKWILAGKYESADMVQSETAAAAAVNEYGGYHQSDKTNNNFVWAPYAGIRYGANGGANATNERGVIRWAGYAPEARFTNNTTQNDRGGRFFIWGVPTEANMANTSLKFNSSPSYTSDLRSSFTTAAKMPFAPSMMMRSSGNVYDQNVALGFDNACPIRCVKMAQADAE